ncbi:hypothetical protein AK812_SmicGene47252, partial [Symbiodinium microadriaticum]
VELKLCGSISPRKFYCMTNQLHDSFLEQKSDEELRQELRDRNLPASGPRERMILRLLVV